MRPRLHIEHSEHPVWKWRWTLGLVVFTAFVLGVFAGAIVFGSVIVRDQEASLSQSLQP